MLYLSVLFTDCSGNTSLKCGDGECISALSRCNQLVDCSDGADERDCTCADYLKAQFLTRKLCDGIVDCWDFSDENNCGKLNCSSYTTILSRGSHSRIQLNYEIL